MAMYGKQQDLCRSSLERKGYYGHFFQDSDGSLRLLHPAELQMCHVTHGFAFTTRDLSQTWKQTGNMITCPHAMLVLVNALNSLKTGKDAIDVEEAFHALLQNRLRADQCSIFHGLHGSFFVANMVLEERNWDLQLANFDAVYIPELEFRLPESHVWHPDHGLQHIEDCQVNKLPSASQITEKDPTTQSEIPPTTEFQLMLRGKFTTCKRQLDLWVTADTQPSALA